MRARRTPKVMFLLSSNSAPWPIAMLQSLLLLYDAERVTSLNTRAAVSSACEMSIFSFSHVAEHARRRQLGLRDVDIQFLGGIFQIAGRHGL